MDDRTGESELIDQYMDMLRAGIDAAERHDPESAARFFQRVLERRSVENEPTQGALQELAATAEEWLAQVAVDESQYGQAMGHALRAVEMSATFRNRATFAAAQALEGLGDLEGAQQKLQVLIEFSDSPDWKHRAAKLEERLQHLRS